MYLRDKIDRRNRYLPISTGKFLRPERRDVVMFEKIHTHGPLDPKYLYAFTKDIGRNYQSLRVRLKDLYHEDNTLHGGRYLARPPQQHAAINSRMIHDNTKYANQVLKEAGRYYEFAPKASPISWFHDYMLGCITAAFELAAGDRYIHHHEIVERIGGKLQFLNKKLRPDRFFGIKYDRGAIIYVLEGDMASEPLRSKTSRKTFERNVELYERFIGQGAHKEDFWPGARLVCLTVTTAEARMRNMMSVVKQKLGPCSYMLFTYLPEFSGWFEPPDPLVDLFTRQWHRAEKEPSVIERGV